MASKSVGRPTKYDPKMAELARNLALLGCTNAEIADELGVSLTTLDNWRADIPEFFGAFKAGRRLARAETAASLHKRANGAVVWKDVLDKDGNVVRLQQQLAPDIASIKFQLTNTEPDKWQDRTENLNVSVQGDLRDLLGELQRRFGADKARTIAQTFGYGAIVDSTAEDISEEKKGPEGESGP